MTAAASPKGDWAWPLKAPSPPLELQFLPPSSAAAAASSETRSLSSSPWTIDPSRLQKLMMGSVAAPASFSTPPAASSGCRSSPDFGACFDPGINKPLPSGWERCLDLKSGEVFIKKCDMNMNGMGGSPTQLGHGLTQGKDSKQACGWPSRAAESVLQADEQRLDWSLRWMQGKPALPTQKSSTSNISLVKLDARLYVEESRPNSVDEQPLCLDLDLRLTSENSSRLASEASDVACLLRSSKPHCSAQVSRDVSSPSKEQPWKWLPLAHSNERPPNIQEMVSESTMATAVCSKCLMYVLLKKSNPTCPRCFNPIILDCGIVLDCGIQPPTVKKRPRLELSPDDLSLSTDSSR